MTFGSNLARLQREIDDLKTRNNTQAAKITELNRKVIERGRIIKRQDGQLQAMEKANARLVDETIALRAAARPLLTEAEDEAGTSAMVELERRGGVW
jgi:uncharacterized coiled-coil protein SlyX